MNLQRREEISALLAEPVTGAGKRIRALRANQGGAAT